MATEGEKKKGLFDLLRNLIDKGEAEADQICGELPPEARPAVEAAVIRRIISKLHKGLGGEHD